MTGTYSKRRRAAPSDTLKARERLIQAAEEQFFQKGFTAASIRTIAANAGVNSALIAYHFGSKEELFRIVFQNAVAPMNQQRIENFMRLETAGDYSVEDVLRAWIEPIFQPAFIHGSRPTAALSFSLGEEQRDLLNQLIAETYSEVNERFLGLMGKLAPHLSRETLVRRLFFMSGAVMLATRVEEHSFSKLLQKSGDTPDFAALTVHVVAFSAPGFLADDAPEAGAS
jgi:AcrR family transcriptional regulator